MNTRIAVSVLALLSAIHCQSANLYEERYLTFITGDNQATANVLHDPRGALDRLVHLGLRPPRTLSARTQSRQYKLPRDVYLTSDEALELAGFLLAVPTGALPADAKVRIESKQLTASLVTISGQTRWTLRIGDDTPWAFIGGKKAADTLGKRITARVREIKTDEIETTPAPVPETDTTDA